jgi:hypothetical protein
MKMTNKRKITILVDSEVVKKAHELGLNVSKVCENCLKQYIEALTNLKMTNGGSFLGEASLEKKVPAGVAEPGQRRRLQEPVP